MTWPRFIAIVVGAGTVSSVTDWIFAGGARLHRYTYPEIWRKNGERQAIARTSSLPFVMCGIFALLSGRLGFHSLMSTLKLAIAVWFIGPLPLILTIAAFIKLHRLFVVSYAFSWLVKLVIAAVAVGWWLH